MANTHRKKHRSYKGKRVAKHKRGGFKLINTALRGFEPVYQMMQSQQSRLTILTISSLKGYMLRLNVSPENSLYKELNKSGSRFGDTITNFILKYVVITPQANETLPSYSNIDKESESAESFLTEANLQQYIWLRSIDGGKPAICPPVGNCFLFENNSSLNMCNYIQTSRNPADGQTKTLFQYFRNILIDPQYGLGILMMPMLSNTVTFYQFLQLNPIRRPYQASMAYFQVAASILAQAIRLLLDIKMLHLDLHMGNSLVSNDGTSTWLIDFGVVSNLMSNKDDKFLTVSEKQSVIGYINNILQDRENVMFPKRSMSPEDQEQNKLMFIERCVEYIKILDKNINSRYYNKQVCQISWAENIQNMLEPPQYHLFLKTVYDKYYSFITVDTYGVPRVSNATIRRSIDTGALVTNNFTEQTSIVTFP